MTYDSSNIFAKILRGEIPCHKVYEDSDAICFMDVMPKLLPLIQKITKASKAAFGADGITVMQFNEPAGGQTVFHLHYHVIPRFDGVPLKSHSGKMEDPAILAANAEKLRAALA